MVHLTSAVFYLLAIKVCEMSDDEERNDIEFIGEYEDYDLEDKAAFKIPRIFDILQTVDLCLLSCKGKACACCHRFLNLVPVCGSSYVDPIEKTMEISLNVTGRRIFNTKIPLNQLEHICQNIKIKTGDVDVCANVSLTEHQRNRDSFRVCAEAEVQLNKVKHFVVNFNCLEFRGDVIFEGEDSSESGKNLASVTILKPLQLVNEIRKMLTKSLMKM